MTLTDAGRVLVEAADTIAARLAQELATRITTGARTLTCTRTGVPASPPPPPAR
ncbi:hypothetical protein [Kitasatospora sp. NPDC059673]|uniref:hypothetical protein n=1 Tax=Kitasatospora sp. NPDC059673 TaxID=3346901 RepID=UPI0036CA1813